MQVGDIVKHKYGTLQGHGIILVARPNIGGVRALWTAHGQSKVHELSSIYLEVISEGD